MERREYAKLEAIEDAMWWFRGAHANLIALIRRAAPRPAGRMVLDAGCGTGGLLARLTREMPDWATVGLDADAGACGAARRKSGRPVCVGSADALPFHDASLAAIVSADVLCHRNVDEVGALREFHRCLAAGGLLVLNLPAYAWLLSEHDRAVHNVRRYTRRRIRALLQAAGFTVASVGYWNAILFPLMVGRRLAVTARESDVKPFPAPLEAAFRAVMRLENAILRRGMLFPFGGSLIATGVKP